MNLARANPNEVLPVLGALLILVGAAILVFSAVSSSRREQHTKRINEELIQFYTEVIDSRTNAALTKQALKNRSQP